MAENKEAIEPVFIFENKDEEVMGIETTTYPNGNKVKRATLSDGRIAVIRELFGRDTKEIYRRIGSNQEDYANGQLSVATTFDGKPAILEDIENIKQKDLNKLIVANAAINF